MNRRTYTKKGLALALGLLLVLGLFSGCGEKPGAGDGESGLVKNITLQVVHRDESVKDFQLATDKETLRQALEEEGLIAGEESEYGLFIKTVNGLTADYDTDGVYWAFYIDGEYATSGVDSTPVTEGAHYSFQVE